MLGRRKKTQNELLEDEARAQQAAGDEAGAEVTRAQKFPEKKGVPTPRRKDQEAARKQPLVGNDRKAARAEQRRRIQEQRTKVRRAMETGEEKYLPERDRGPQRRLARDYIDARFGIGEWLLIVVLVFLVGSFVMPPDGRAMVVLVLWAMMAGVVLECLWVGHQVRRRVDAKFGAGNRQRGIRFYAAMRALQMRRLRLPKPMVRRGEFPT